MRRAAFFFSSLFFVSTAFSQPYYYSLPGIPFLESRAVLGTGLENHYSMRIFGMGASLAPFIEDHPTDCYRNPAYFTKASTSSAFGELYQTGSHFRAGAGYSGEFGILLRGNNQRSSGDYSVLFTEPLYGNLGRSSTTRRDSNTGRNTIGAINLGYGFPVNGNLSYGIGYALGLSESPRFSRDLEIRDEFTLDPTRIDSSYYYSSNSYSEKFRQLSHVIRAGMLWGEDGTTIDGVATVEILSRENRGDGQFQARSYQAYGGPRSYFFRDIIYADGIGLSFSEMSGWNSGIDARLRMKSEGKGVFIATFGVRFGKFKSDESFVQDRTEYLLRSSYFVGYDTTFYSTSSSGKLSRVANPRGTGIGLRGGIGWTRSFDRWLVSAGVLGNYQRLSFSYDLKHKRHEVITIVTDTTLGPIRFDEDRLYGYSHTVYAYGITAPIGCEYEVVTGFKLRLGWFLEYTGELVEQRSDETSYKRSQDRFSGSFVTFGFGLSVSERIRADFAGAGEFTKLNDWNLALTYNL